ncbi:hypothetical protein XENORESO_005255 [Xenotaenia resolanae]|uniref:Uncharacterized protein n=1 Tax=Xenotaenia resolanae TaxID=208358 RepID=A0ABV0VWK1_9TELE
MTPLGSLSFTHIFCLAPANLHSRPFQGKPPSRNIFLHLSLLSLHITMSSTNIIVHGYFCLTSSINLSITTADKKGLRADPGCNPTTNLNSFVTPTAHLTTVLQLS